MNYQEQFILRGVSKCFIFDPLVPAVRIPVGGIREVSVSAKYKTVKIDGNRYYCRPYASISSISGNIKNACLSHEALSFLTGGQYVQDFPLVGSVTTTWRGGSRSPEISFDVYADYMSNGCAPSQESTQVIIPKMTIVGFDLSFQTKSYVIANLKYIAVPDPSTDDLFKMAGGI